MNSHEIRTWPRSEDSPAQLDLHAWDIYSSANTNTRAVNKVAGHAIQEAPVERTCASKLQLQAIDAGDVEPELGGYRLRVGEVLERGERPCGRRRVPHEGHPKQMLPRGDESRVERDGALERGLRFVFRIPVHRTGMEQPVAILHP